MLKWISGAADKFRTSVLAPGGKKETYRRSSSRYDDDDYDDDEYDDDDRYEYDDDYEDESDERSSRRGRRQNEDKKESARRERRESLNLRNPLDDNKIDFDTVRAKKEPQRSGETFVFYPKKIEDITEVAAYVRSGNVCIIDITSLNKEVGSVEDKNFANINAQRIADYLCGVAQGLQGEVKRINYGIFTVSPQEHRIVFPFKGMGDKPKSDSDLFSERKTR